MPFDTAADAARSFAELRCGRHCASTSVLHPADPGAAHRLPSKSVADTLSGKGAARLAEVSREYWREQAKKSASRSSQPKVSGSIYSVRSNLLDGKPRIYKRWSLPGKYLCIGLTTIQVHRKR